jgi:serine/threonine protein kinase
MGLCPECLMKSAFNTGTAPGTERTGSFVPPGVDALRPFFPQLEILELIGRGGMGAVYKARQPGLDRLVALKILPSHAGGDPNFADRFNREARALARLQHPRIVTVHDFGIAGGMHYLVMEFVDGPNLRQVQRAGRLAPAQALRIVPEICEALQFAHDHGIVHRDIKPENLLLDRDGHVKITDFGIAKMMGPDADTMSLTGAVDVIGTPHYMAPEQIEKPADVDHRADIYSLGVVFYELLTGELPLGRFAAPSSRVQVDVRLDEVVLRSLEKEPAKRYQQVSQVKTRLDTIAGSPPPTDAPVRLRRWPVNAVPAAVLYVLQALLVAVSAHYYPGMWGPAEFGMQASPWHDPFRWLALHALALVIAYIAWGVLHHSCWSVLPARYRATTPGKAVGLLFVPFFNFYWAFPSFMKLADGFNAVRDEHPELLLRNARELAIAKAVSFVAFWTIGWMWSLVSIVVIIDAALFIAYYRVIVANANDLIAWNAKAASGPDLTAGSTLGPGSGSGERRGLGAFLAAGLIVVVGAYLFIALSHSFMDPTPVMNGLAPGSLRNQLVMSAYSLVALLLVGGAAVAVFRGFPKKRTGA